MIQQTVERLLPVTKAEDIWVLTNAALRSTIVGQLAELDGDHILSEPAARNTAPACALAAFMMERTQAGLRAGNFSVRPCCGAIRSAFVKWSKRVCGLRRGATGLLCWASLRRARRRGMGTLSAARRVDLGGDVQTWCVKRFTEKPDRKRAEFFFSSNAYAWNSGIFLWSAKTLTNAIRQYCPGMAEPLEKIAAAYGTPEFEQVFADEYVKCTDISIDFAVLEPRSKRGEAASEIYCLPGGFWMERFGVVVGAA